MESCSNSLRFRKSSSLDFLKISLGFVFFVGDVIIGVGFHLFGRVYLTLGANPISHFLAQVFLETTVGYDPIL